MQYSFEPKGCFTTSGKQWAGRQRLTKNYVRAYFQSDQGDILEKNRSRWGRRTGRNWAWDKSNSGMKEGNTLLKRGNQKQGGTPEEKVLGLPGLYKRRGKTIAKKRHMYAKRRRKMRSKRGGTFLHKCDQWSGKGGTHYYRNCLEKRNKWKVEKKPMGKKYTGS